MVASAGPERFRFFAGKGGVGKTTCAAAWALDAARHGARVLLVSTDPAHSLGDALQVRLGPSPRRISVARGALDAVELDADRALRRWLSRRRAAFRTVALRGLYLDADDVNPLFDLSLPGVDELAGLLELDRLAKRTRYDRVVVDTAPTGHTLRLFATPDTLANIATVLDDMNAKHEAISQQLGAGIELGDAGAALIAEISQIAVQWRSWLADASVARVAWVMLPEAMSLAETRDGLAALQRGGITVDEVVVNRVTAPPSGRCSLCTARRALERQVIATAQREFAPTRCRLVPALDAEPRGVPKLLHAGRALVKRDRGAALLAPATARVPRAPRTTTVATRWIARVVPDGARLVIVGGKGGVGKTTLAAALAAAFARTHPAREVLLLSADPAHSLADVLGVPVGDRGRRIPGAGRLRARELDASAAWESRRERYREQVEALFDALAAGHAVDAGFDRAIVRDLIDLAPPGLDELFAMLAIVDAVVSPPRGRRANPLVVLDTAPSGHALRLLEMPAHALAWVHQLMSVLLKYRAAVGLGDVARDLLATAHELRALESLLRNPTRTRFIVVTRAAELPSAESVRLLDRLADLGIAARAVCVNAMTPPGCSRCMRARTRERRAIRAFVRATASRARERCDIFTAPALAPPPHGIEALLRLSVEPLE